jgi:hypothetical protein
MASLIDVTRELGTEDACLDYLENVRWPSGLACLKCGSMKVGKTLSTVKNRKTKAVTGTRRVYDCLEPECGHQFSATTGTLFHDSHLPLPTWFLAIAIYCNAKKSVSALQLQRDLKVSYRTAWYLGHRIRKAMQQDGGIFGQGGNAVEVDETYVGGAYDKRRKRAPWKKAGVVGAIERGSRKNASRVVAQPIRRIKGGNAVERFVIDRVSTNARMVCTDEHTYYRILAEKGYHHERVVHIAKQWTRGTVHTNAIENFWSLFKRSIAGQFHSISVKHLGSYVDETAYKFNRRGTDYFPETVSRLVNSEPMPFALLVEPKSID